MSLTDDALAKLKELQAFIEEQSWTETPQSLLSVIIQGEVLPFLSVIPAPTQPDPFLRDLNSLRLNVAFVSRDLDDKNGASPYQLKAFLYSASSREIVLEVALTDDDFLSDMSPVLNTISASQDTTHCPGFDAEEAEELFSKIRKVDLPSLLIEKYDGKILYRSRTCKYVVFDVDEEETSVDKVRFGSGRHCSDCDRLFKEVDLKYNGGKFSGSADAVQVPKQEEKEPEDAPDDLPQETGEDTGAEEVPDEDEEGERGPPKKRKRRSRGINKSLFGSEFVDPDAALKATVKSEPELTPKKENDENTPDNTAPTKAELDTADAEDLMAGEDDPDDEDYVRPRRTSRLRKMSSKLTQDEHRGSPRKRGRPPIVTKPTKCQECGKVFVILKEYRDHCLEHTNNFPCTFEGCSRRFKVELDLDIHLRKHRGEKPYMCKICDQTFGARQELKVHNKQHVGKKPFKCELCPKSFARYQQRKIHMVIHTGEKSYLCPDCGNCFGSFSTLIDHRKRKHLEMRPYKCDDCPKAFFTRQELEAHVRTHTGDKPYLCTLCGKGFSRSHHLKRHKESVHKEGSKNRPQASSSSGASSTPSASSSLPKLSKFSKRQPSSTSSTLQPSSRTIALEGGMLRLEDSLGGETVLVTTEEEAEGAVMVGDIQHEYIIEGQPGIKYTTSIASDGTPILVERIRPEDGAQEAAAVSQQQQEEIQYTTIQSGAAAATSLIELSQAPVASLVEGNEQETILVQAGSPEVQDQQHAQLVDGTTMVEIQGHPDHGSGLTNNYILVTTGDNEQRLVPVSATTAEASHQQQVISEEEVVVVEEGEEREQEQQQLKTHNLEVIREEQEDESRAENQS